MSRCTTLGPLPLLNRAMHKIWFEWPLPRELEGLLESVVVPLGPASLTPDEPFAALPGADAIIAAAELQYTNDVFQASTQLRVISRIGVGYDNIDVAAATRRGIAVCNAPDAPTISTAEHTIALMFAVAKGVPAARSQLRRGDAANSFLQNRGRELCGLTLGVVGLGRIGQRVAQLAQGLGMNVVAYDPHARTETLVDLHVVRCESLDDLLAEADVVSLHAPFNESTRHLINETTLQQMKPGSILINTSRGGLVDEPALAKSLRSGHLFGAGLDVFAAEPPAPDHPLLQLENVVATPHIASATDVSKSNLWTTAIRQALDVLNGRRPPHLVNPEIW